MSTEFRIYYGDGGPPYEGTLEGIEKVLDVQCVVTPDLRNSPYETGRLVMHSWDFYLYAEGSWMGINGVVDLVDHILHRPIEKVIKGRMIPNKKYEEILSRAMHDEGYPRKSNKSPAREDGSKK